MTDVADFHTKETFEDLLQRAEAAAHGDWDCSFVSDMRERWDKYKMRTSISHSQLSQLERIAKE